MYDHKVLPDMTGMRPDSAVSLVRFDPVKEMDILRVSWNNVFELSDMLHASCTVNAVQPRTAGDLQTSCAWCLCEDNFLRRRRTHRRSPFNFDRRRAPV